MEEAIHEMAVTGFRGRSSGNITLWILIAIVFIGFSRGGQGFGNFFGGGNCPEICESSRSSKRSKRSRRSCKSEINNGFTGFPGASFLGKGGNLWFILIIIGILFVLSDGLGGSNTNIVNVETETETEVEEC